MTQDRDDAPSGQREVIPIAREELRVEARATPTARVSARKHVTTRDELIDLPLARDEVTVERVPKNEVVDAAPPIREEGDTTIVPVLEEVLVVEKRLLLREEVRIVRRRREERHTRRVTLRREDVVVERAPLTEQDVQQKEDEVMTTDRYTIIGLFDRREQATAAREDLLLAGCDEGSIRLTDEARAKDRSFWDKLKEAFGADDASTYGEASRRGGTLLQLDDLSSAQVDACAQILERHGAVNIDHRAAEWRQAGWAGLGSAQGEGLRAGATEETIPVTEERLKVGVRREQRGGVRVYSRVKEEPVSEQVTLRDEHVKVERRAVDRPAGAGAFEERTIEATELHEEPVVSKEARVVEEVVVSKDVDERTETIEETVRKIDVEVQDLEVDFRRDYETRYAASGVTFDEVRPAYDYGRELAEHETDKSTSWQTIESQARADFEQRNPGMWDRYRDAVRRGYERSLARR